ncbi:GNAT family N-acetyltransferase [Rhodanobacter ginsengisoli]|uniref:GNAT family N-acetyltransferase n=1 Tax=Rhodanobacter ginsengisoli TaxID=418646 RepID=A0ABW0QN92_9GAMM
MNKVIASETLKLGEAEIVDMVHKLQSKTPLQTGWTEQLHDGTPVWIRPSNRHDAKLELEFLNRLSPELRSLRFLGLVQDASPEVIRELTDPDPRSEMALIALISNEGRDQEIGAAHFRVDTPGDSCDCTVTVSAEWQQRGVASHLMRHLIEAARARGIQHMHAVAPVQDEDSHNLALRLGFERRQDPHDPAVMLYDLKLS